MQMNEDLQEIDTQAPLKIRCYHGGRATYSDCAMHVYGMSLLEQPVELRHAGGKAGSEVGSVQILDRNVRERQAGIASCGSLALDPTLPPVLVRLQTEDRSDLLRF
jgi:hypothetical protein